MVREYYKKVAALHGPKEQGQDVPLRAASCESCHKREYAQWKASHHANAYASLVKRERQFDPDCLPCHTTRFDEPQGFSMQSHERDLIGVQCESCHGLIAEHGRGAGKPQLRNRRESIASDATRQSTARAFKRTTRHT